MCFRSPSMTRHRSEAGGASWRKIHLPSPRTADSPASISGTNSRETGLWICHSAKTGGLFTRVLGGGLDIGRGVSGSLRANAVAGQSISVSDPTALKWFNTAAFCLPSTTCANPNGFNFGDAGRNIIEGPGQVSMNMSLNKTIQIKDSRALELRISANDVFNTVHFTSINTVVNSFTFGEVTGTGGMRRVTMQARFRFLMKRNRRLPRKTFS